MATMPYGDEQIDYQELAVMLGDQWCGSGQDMRTFALIFVVAFGADPQRWNEACDQHARLNPWAWLPPHPDAAEPLARR